MTALAGIWYYDAHPNVSSDCDSMLSSLARYGPDGCDQWSDDNVAMGRRLFKLLPEDEFDSQPLHGAGGEYVLVADLRLDNREELTSLLNIPHHEASRQSDAAILLAAFERWGEECVTRLVGDYAFALWDAPRRRLLLICDPMGQRRLYYHRGKGFFAFSTMIKGLHALEAIPYEFDEDKLVESFYPVPQMQGGTYFRGIESLPQGHILSVTKGNLSRRCHWTPNIRPLGLHTPDDYAEALRGHLDEAVKCRLRGVKDVGAELSGGLDSSAVAATAARLLAPNGGRVIAFTAVPREGYDGPVPRGRLADESAHAAATAALYPNMDHVLVRSANKSPLDVLDRNYLLFDGPTTGFFNVAWGHELLDQVHDYGLRVLLNGQSGNLGMSYHGMGLLPELFRTGRWLRLFREGRALKAHGTRWRSTLAQAIGPWCPTPIWKWLHRHFSARGKAPVPNYSCIKAQRIAELNIAERVKENGLDISRPLWKDSVAERIFFLRRTSPGGSLKGTLGGWKIDCRDPSSDLRLLEFCLSVPCDQYLHKGVKRALARRAFSDRLPEIVIEETRRGYQAADWHEALCADRNRISEEIERLVSCSPVARNIDIPRLKNLLDKDWPKDGWANPDVVYAYRYVLGEALATAHYVRRASGSNA